MTHSTKKTAKNAKSKSVSAKTGEVKSKPWGKRCPYDVIARIDDRGCDLAALYEDQVAKIERLTDELAFEKTLLVPLQAQIEQHIAQLARESTFVPRLPKIFDAGLHEQLDGVTALKKLRATGGTDKQIMEAIPGGFSNTNYRIWKRWGAPDKEPLQIERRSSVGEDIVFVKGNAEVVAEVRRILDIPQPVKVAVARGVAKKQKSARSPRKAPPTKSPAKKPAAKVATEDRRTSEPPTSKEVAPSEAGETLDAVGKIVAHATGKRSDASRRATAVAPALGRKNARRKSLGVKQGETQGENRG